MKPLRKIWTAQKEKPISLWGEYYSSHPDIHGYDKLVLEFSESGVEVHKPGFWFPKKRDKSGAIKKFKWSEITGFETDVEREDSSSQRLTVTRMATLGIFSLAAPKKTGAAFSSFSEVLHTTTGDIKLVAKIGWDGNQKGMAATLEKRDKKIRERDLLKIKRIVAEHATRKVNLQ